MASATERVPYERLKAWISGQEEYERRFGQPAPLTHQQRLALAVLVPPQSSPRPLSPPSPPTPQPAANGNIGTVDWVSLLSRGYVQASRLPHVMPTYRDEPVPCQNGTLLWRCLCQLPREAPGRWFPDEMERLLAEYDGTFARKKDAKQYAARCAVVWLRGRGETFFDRASAAAAASLATSPARSTAVPATSAGSPSMPSPSRQPAVSEGTDAGADSDADTAAAATEIQPTNAFFSSAAPAAARPDNAVPAGSHQNDKLFIFRGATSGGANGEDISNTQRLDTLCKTLRLGSPTYDLKANEESAASIFSGNIVFPTLAANKRGGRAAISLPPGIGVVKDVYTKQAAREKIAQSVLTYLYDSMLSGVAIP